MDFIDVFHDAVIPDLPPVSVIIAHIAGGRPVGGEVFIIPVAYRTVGAIHGAGHDVIGDPGGGPEAPAGIVVGAEKGEMLVAQTIFLEHVAFEADGHAGVLAEIVGPEEGGVRAHVFPIEIILVELRERDGEIGNEKEKDAVL